TGTKTKMLLWRLSIAIGVAFLARGAFGAQNQDELVSCKTDQDCHTDTTFLKCHGGVCKCNSVSHFDPSQRTCVIHAGGTCDMVALTKSRVQKCVQNALCYSKLQFPTKGRCKCKETHFETTHGTCISASGSCSISSNLIVLVLMACTTGMMSKNYFPGMWDQDVCTYCYVERISPEFLGVDVKSRALGFV
ncbi:unnamed protein product, partial [Allacma fusca]